MQSEYDYLLDQTRNDKIKALGFLCYNQCVDGTMSFPEMNRLVSQIKEKLEYLMSLRQRNSEPIILRIKEEELGEKLTELGCICYNLYVDKKLINDEVLNLCGSISSINNEIISGSKLSKTQDDFEGAMSKNCGEVQVSKADCPAGMEPIPHNYKKCICGYKNKAVARFCGKCGAIL